MYCRQQIMTLYSSKIKQHWKALAWKVREYCCIVYRGWSTANSKKKMNQSEGRQSSILLQRHMNNASPCVPEENLQYCDRTYFRIIYIARLLVSCHKILFSKHYIDEIYCANDPPFATALEMTCYTRLICRLFYNDWPNLSVSRPLHSGYGQRQGMALLLQGPYHGAMLMPNWETSNNT